MEQGWKTNFKRFFATNLHWKLVTRGCELLYVTRFDEDWLVVSLNGSLPEKPMYTLTFLEEKKEFDNWPHNWKRPGAIAHLAAGIKILLNKYH